MKMFRKDVLSIPIFKSLLYLFFLGACIGKGYAQVQTQNPVSAKVSSRIGGFWESLPVNYQAQTNKKFPLLIFIHGKGEIGDGSTAALAKVSNTGVSRLIKQGKFPSSFNVNGESFSFIVISPQITGNAYAQAPVFIGELLEYCKKNYRVDEQRIYITGLSMGGGMTWSALTTHAATFAAAVPVCGSYTMVSAGAKLMADSQLPIWCTHNDGDPTISVEVTKKWYNQLVNIGTKPSPKMTIFKSTSHDAWSKTYDPSFKEDGKNIYEWMLSYKRGGVVPPQAPVANAGADQTITLPVSNVTLDGSKSTASSGSIKTYAWTKLSGPGQGSITSAANATTTVTGLTEGTYTFQLKVTDANGASSADNIVVTVKAALLPPVANAGNAQSITLPVSSVTLDGSKSTAPSGTIKSYQWTRVSGPTSGTITNAASASTTITGLAEGVYTFQLKITDSNNSSATATVTVSVYAAPVPPVANAGGDKVIELPVNTVTLDGSKSTASAGNIVNYQWTKVSGPAQGNIADAGASVTAVSGLVEGVYEFELKVTDNKGLNATATINVTVNAAKVPPTADAGTDVTVTLPVNEVNLTGAKSQASGGNEIKSYQWTKVSGPAGSAIVTANAVNTTVKALVAGIYVFELKVSDNNGLASTATVTVTVKAELLPPVANAGLTQTIVLPTSTVVLDGSKSTAPSGTIQKYEWKKKSGPVDGIIEDKNNAKTNVSGLTEGVYEWELTVTDNNGLSAVAVVKVIVNAAPLPPVAVAGDDIIITVPTDIATLDASASHATSGSITSYSWVKTSGDVGVVIDDATKAVTQLSGLKEGVYEFELTVKDNRGSVATDKITVKVIAVPVADAGADITVTLPVNKVRLDASASIIPSASSVTYLWRKVSGPGSGTISDNNAIAADATGLSEGEYEFQLQLRDDYGNVSTDNVIVKVLPEPKAPVADAGTDQTIILPVNSVELDASRSTASAEIVSYLWKKVSGPSAGNIDEPAGVKANALQLEEGIYEFELTIKDANGQTATASVTITVQAKPLPPVVDAGDDQTISLPQDAVTLSGTATGEIDAYEWTKVSGPDGGIIETPGNAVTNISGLIEGVYEFELKATNNKGLSASSVVTITVNAAPLPPVADAGNPQTITLPDNEVTLDAGASTAPAGNIEKYEWIKIAGPVEGAITSNNIVATLVTGLVEGVYKFQVKVTDNSGATSTSAVTITVKAAPQPPVANAGNAQTITLPNSSVNLDGSKSLAPSGSIEKYEWSKVSGPAGEEWIDADKAGAAVNNLSEGVYQFELKVTDNNAAVSTATVTVTVKAAPKAPVANAGSAQTITLPVNSVTLNGSLSDAPSGTIEKYEWSKVSGPAAGNIVTADGAITEVNQLEEAIYTFELKVTDNHGATATATVTVTVKAALLPPVASAGNDVVIVLPKNSVTLNGSKSKAPSGTIRFKWSQVSGASNAILTNGASAVATASALTEGLYEFSLEVTDNHGAKNTDTIKVTVLPQPAPPVADAGTDQVITLPIDVVELDGSKSSSINTTIENFEWKQLSGPSQATISEGSIAITQAGQLQEGVYEFELTVTDKNGLTSADKISITVKAALVAPVANAGTDQEITLPVNSIDLDGSASHDSDGNIVSYQWVKVSGPVSGSIQDKGKAVTKVTGLAQGRYVFELTVTDNDALVSSKRIQVTVKAAPALPVANAGSSKTITLPTDEVSLDGSRSSAPAGSITAYQWTKISGPDGGTVKDAAKATTLATELVAGTYVFELEVTDDHGGKARATVSVVVNDAPVPPVANAGNNQTITLPVNTVTLNGTKSSASGTVEKYEWIKLSGPEGGAITQPKNATTAVTGLMEGEYQYQLKVTDNNGLTAVAVITITVKPTPLPPVADAGTNQVITLPANTVTLNGSKSFGVSAILATYEWSVLSGPAGAVIKTANAEITTVEGLKEGAYEFMLKVTDEAGRSASSVVAVEVKPIPMVPPVAIAGDNFTIQLPVSSIQLDGSRSFANDNATITSYVWTKISGPNPLTLINAGAAKTTVVASVPGNYLFRLTVTDSRGLTSYDDILVNILPVAEEQPLPVAYAGETQVLTLPENSVELNGWASYSEYGEITGYQWKLLSGPSQPVISNAGADVATVSNLVEGEYEFELTVTDNNGKSAAATVKVVVNNAGGKPDFSSANVKLYPNPVQSVGTLEIKTETKGRTIVDVFDSNARRVMRKEFVKDDFNGRQQLDFSKLTNGVYFVEVIVDYRFRTVVKVIKN